MIETLATKTEIFISLRVASEKAVSRHTEEHSMQGDADAIRTLDVSSMYATIIERASAHTDFYPMPCDARRRWSTVRTKQLMAHVWLRRVHWSAVMSHVLR